MAGLGLGLGQGESRFYTQKRNTGVSWDIRVLWLEGKPGMTMHAGMGATRPHSWGLARVGSAHSHRDRAGVGSSHRHRDWAGAGSAHRHKDWGCVVG